MFKSLRPLVFYPKFLILVSALILSLVDLEYFTAVTGTLNSKVLGVFSWLFSLGSFYLLVLVAITYFSKLGDIRIGGEKSTPLITKPRWFMIVLCTTLAVGVFILLIVATFVFSAASGLNKGIARLSKANFWMLIALFVFVLICGPTVYMLSIGVEGLGAYLQNFFRLSLFTGQAANDPWPQWWSVFYWAVWFAWAPITAMFLGKIARGYTVREFIQVNVLFPSLFILFWVSVFAGTALYLDTSSDGALYEVLNNGGVEQLLYYIMDQMPLSGVTSFFLILVAFISYVTAADSSTDAIGDLCTKDFTSESDEGTALPIKILWGSLIGLVAWIMVSTVGINDVKQLSNLGGLPATLIILACSLTLIKWLRNPSALKK